MAEAINRGAPALHQILLAALSGLVLTALQMPDEAECHRADFVFSRGRRGVVGFVSAVPDGLRGAKTRHHRLLAASSKKQLEDTRFGRNAIRMNTDWERTGFRGNQSLFGFCVLPGQ